MVVGQVKQYKASQVHVHVLINSGNSNLACQCTCTGTYPFPPTCSLSTSCVDATCAVSLCSTDWSRTASSLYCLLALSSSLTGTLSDSWCWRLESLKRRASWREGGGGGGGREGVRGREGGRKGGREGGRDPCCTYTSCNIHVPCVSPGSPVSQLQPSPW